MPEHYALRSPEEAANVILEQLDSWHETEGFIEWIFARFGLWEREVSKRAREQKRKLRANKAKRKKSRK
jgi:hypothetical protein